MLRMAVTGRTFQAGASDHPAPQAKGPAAIATTKLAREAT